jgi:hypothetical protein
MDEVEGQAAGSIFGPALRFLNGPEVLWHEFKPPKGGRLWFRHPSPPLGDWKYPGELLDLSDEDRWALTAYHEAGHAVAYEKLGVGHVERVVMNGIDAEGEVTTRGISHCDFHEYAVAQAAGERASQRWLVEQGLYNPVRGWVVEVRGLLDRREAIKVAADQAPYRVSVGERFASREPGRGRDNVDWSYYQSGADLFVAQHWTDVSRTAQALLQTQQLTGDQLRALLATH